MDLGKLVKPLTWKRCSDEWLRAVSIVGQYNVMWGIEPGVAYLDHAQKLTTHPSPEAAQSAANADHAARVIAALDGDALRELVGALAEVTEIAARNESAPCVSRARAILANLGLTP